MIKVRMNQDRNFIPIKNSLFTIPQVSCFFIVRIEERIKIKFYAKIRLYKLPAFTTSTNPHRKFQIPMIYNMNILDIFLQPTQNISGPFVSPQMSTPNRSGEISRLIILPKVHNVILISQTFLLPVHKVGSAGGYRF